MKRYKRAHSVLNLKVLSMCLAHRKIFENVGFFFSAFFILSDLDPYLLSYIYVITQDVSKDLISFEIYMVF